jgi:hypothetical protein
VAAATPADATTLWSDHESLAPDAWERGRGGEAGGGGGGVCSGMKQRLLAIVAPENFVAWPWAWGVR